MNLADKLELWDSGYTPAVKQFLNPTPHIVNWLKSVSPNPPLDPGYDSMSRELAISYLKGIGISDSEDISSIIAEFDRQEKPSVEDLEGDLPAPLVAQGDEKIEELCRLFRNVHVTNHNQLSQQWPEHVKSVGTQVPLPKDPRKAKVCEAHTFNPKPFPHPTKKDCGVQTELHCMHPWHGGLGWYWEQPQKVLNCRPG